MPDLGSTHPGAKLLGRRVTITSKHHPWYGYSGHVVALEHFMGAPTLAVELETPGIGSLRAGCAPSDVKPL